MIRTLETKKKSDVKKTAETILLRYLSHDEVKLIEDFYRNRKGKKAKIQFPWLFLHTFFSFAGFGVRCFSCGSYTSIRK